MNACCSGLGLCGTLLSSKQRALIASIAVDWEKVRAENRSAVEKAADNRWRGPVYQS